MSKETSQCVMFTCQGMIRMFLFCPGCQYPQPVEKFSFDLTCESCNGTYPYEQWMETTRKVKEEVKRVNGEEKKQPIKKEWIGLGENYGVSIAQWPNGITLTKRKKEGEQWQDTEKFNLSAKVMTELFVRIPTWFKEIKEEKTE